jgi:putative copper resistance protein D
MVLDTWMLAGSVAKLLSLMAAAGVIGGSFSLGLAQRLDIGWQPALENYLLISAVTGLLATALFFLIQVGAINQSGIRGMLDTQMASIIGQSGLGSAAGLRVLGFCSVLPAWYLLRQRSASSGLIYGSASFLLIFVAVSLLCTSFALTGHTSTLALPVRAAIALHVLAAFLWVGSLYPLLSMSTTADLPRVQRLMRSFGTSALLIVAVLLLSGIFMLTQLLHSFAELTATDYGQVLLLKLTGVSALLALAGINKLLLVPQLTAGNSAGKLRASIRMEITVALFILAVTTWLTSALGPSALQGS